MKYQVNEITLIYNRHDAQKTKLTLIHYLLDLPPTSQTHSISAIINHESANYSRSGL